MRVTNNQKRTFNYTSNTGGILSEHHITYYLVIFVFLSVVLSIFTRCFFPKVETLLVDPPKQLKLKEEQEFFTCAICVENTPDRCLKNCGHVFCSKCIEKLPSVEKMPRIFECPFCKCETSREEGVIRMFF